MTKPDLWEQLERAHLTLDQTSQLHDPIPEAGVLEFWQRIVVLEGNYWPLDEAPWNSYWPLIALRILLRAEPDNLLVGLRERHLRGGKSAEFIDQHMAITDLPNIDACSIIRVRRRRNPKGGQPPHCRDGVDAW